MNKSLVFALTLGALTSCTPAQRVAVKEAIKPPTPVAVEDIVLKSLQGGPQYLSKFNTQVYTDGTVLPVEVEEFNFVQSDIDRQFKIKDQKWEYIAVFYTKEIINCGGTVAMGCTQPYPDGTAIVVVSLYFPYRRMVLRHELTHVAYFWNNEPEMRHFCLDNPALCNDAGTTLRSGFDD